MGKEHLRKLIWVVGGYQPVGYEWNNYGLHKSGVVMKHDLYEHQIGESGTWEEEFRAFGGRQRFIDKFEIVDYGRNHAKYWKTVTTQIIKSVPTEKFDGLDVDIERFCLDYLEVEHPYFFANLLMQGYTNALQYSKEAHTRLSEIDFYSLHNAGQNITVDLMKGKVVKLTNSPEARNIRKAQEACGEQQGTRTLANKVEQQMYIENGGI